MSGLSAGDPRAVGGYSIEGKLGEGGMGRVYRGRSPGGRLVAVKVARAELAADPGFRARFRSEVEAARRVGGFHTAQVVDADSEAEPPWMVTAYIPGRSLDQVVAEDGPLSASALQALGAALAEALQAIHDCGLVHRDLKPSNIIMSDDGPRVIDFGIAHALEGTRLTATDQVIGSAGFLAPEQVTGEQVGAACDLFALGAVLVHAAGGRAFGEGSSMSLMYRIAHIDADVSALPQPMRSVVARCLQRDPSARMTTAELLAALNPRDMTQTTPATVGSVTATLPPTQSRSTPVHSPTELDAATRKSSPISQQRSTDSSVDFKPFWFAVPGRREVMSEEGGPLSPVEELVPGVWYLAVDRRGSALLVQTPCGNRLLQDLVSIEIGTEGVSNRQSGSEVEASWRFSEPVDFAFSPDFHPFWFAVPGRREVMSEEGGPLSPVEELVPGVWYLALGRRGSALLVQTPCGNRLLQNLVDIERG